MQTLAKEIQAGREIARRAGEIAMRYFRTGVASEDKPDLSPVTVADRECERAIVSALDSAFPDDGILGEEGSNKESRGGRRWIVDPIDGTRDFMRGSVSWAVLIGLEAGGEVVAGFAYMPALGDLFFAARGQGAYCNDDRIHASTIDSPGRAVLCVNDFDSILKYAFAGELLDWMRRFWSVRSMGGCLDALMVARGQADLWLEPAGKPWDFAALKIIAEEAGACYFDFQGAGTIYNGNCVICAPGLETVARRFVLQNQL